MCDIYRIVVLDNEADPTFKVDQEEEPGFEGPISNVNEGIAQGDVLTPLVGFCSHPSL